jgi:hypothetical protein
MFAFHRLQLTLPRSWNPTKIEGDFDKGQVLFADMDHPRLGLRWQRVGRESPTDTGKRWAMPTLRGRFDPAAWSERSLREEVGRLAAAEAREGPAGLLFEGSRLYVEPKPPGRDVWIGYSAASGRMIQLVYHARRRDRVLGETILPGLVDTPSDEPAAWSIFDLSCMTPAGFLLQNHRLMAGDLSLTFTREREFMMLRQIGVAELALSRRPINQWLADQERKLRPHYRPVGNLRETTIAVGGRKLSAFARDAVRMKRFGWKYWIGREAVTYAAHDLERDRLLLFQGSSAKLIEDLAATVE